MEYVIKGLLGGEMFFATKEELRSFVGGMEHALRSFAHWSNGNQFVVKRQTAAKMGRNPKTGAALQIPARTKLVFTASSELRGK